MLLNDLLGKPPNGPLRQVTSRFWVGPLDVELTRTVSHAYLAFAGLGRWDGSFHNINWRGLIRDRWAPLTHSEIVHDPRAAPLFARVEEATSLLWWDDRMALLEHRISSRGRLSATVYSRGTFFAGRERVVPARCVIGLPPEPPEPKPTIVSLWEQADALFAAAEGH